MKTTLNDDKASISMIQNISTTRTTDDSRQPTTESGKINKQQYNKTKAGKQACM